MGQQPSSPKITAHDRAIFQMKQQRDKLKQYQKRLGVVVARQTALAKDSLVKGDKEKAKFYLRSKKHQETIITKTYDQLDNLETLLGTIEFKLIEKDVLYGLQQGNAVLSKLNNEMSVDKIDKLMDDLEDERVKVQEISGVLGGSLSNGEEMEVDEEFERLEREMGLTEEKPEVETSDKLPDVPDTLPEAEVPEALEGLPGVPDTVPEIDTVPETGPVPTKEKKEEPQPLAA